MGRALIVSAGANSNEYIAARLSEMGYSRPVIIPSGAEARRRMSESDFELIIVNAPLPDEFGHELCITAVEQTDAGVVFLVKAAQAEQLLAPLNEQGVLLLSKPFTTPLFLQAMHMAAAGNHRLQRLRQENARLQDKIGQLRLVSRAKCCLVEHAHMTEAEAHRYLEKQAMDTRRDRAEGLLWESFILQQRKVYFYGKIYFCDRRRGLRSGQGHYRCISGSAFEVPRPEGGQPEAGPLCERGPGHHEPAAARRGVRDR